MRLQRAYFAVHTPALSRYPCMNAIQEQAVSVLRDLISTCRDGQEMFRTASECVADDPELKMLLSSFSLQRSKFAGELETQLMNLGEHRPERGGPDISGAARRGWMNLKAAVKREDNHSILAECERAEDGAMAEYNKALAHEMPDPIHEIVYRQRQEVMATHNTIRSLRDATPSQVAAVMATALESARAAQRKGERIATRAWGEVKSTAQDWRQSTEGYVRSNPISTLASALLVGFGVGMIFYALEVLNEHDRIQVERRPLRRVGTALAAWFGFLAGRARTGYRSSVKQVENLTEDLTDKVPERFRGSSGNRLVRPLRRAWRRVGF